MSDNTVYLGIFGGMAGVIIGGIAISSHFKEKELARQHELDMEKAKMYQGMSPEDRKDILIEEEKTKQARAAQAKSEAEENRIKMVKSLIENPVPQSTENSGVSIRLA